MSDLLSTIHKLDSSGFRIPTVKNTRLVPYLGPTVILIAQPLQISSLNKLNKLNFYTNAKNLVVQSIEKHPLSSVANLLSRD